MDWRQLEITIENVIDTWEEIYGEDITEEYPTFILRLIEEGACNE